MSLFICITSSICFLQPQELCDFTIILPQNHVICNQMLENKKANLTLSFNMISKPGAKKSIIFNLVMNIQIIFEW